MSRDDSRTETISIRVTKADHRALSKRAAEADMTLSEYVRKMLTGDAPRMDGLAVPVEIHYSGTGVNPINIIWSHLGIRPQ